MMIYLNIILKSKHGFAGLFSLWLLLWLNYFSLHLQVKRLVALNMHAKTEISLKKFNFECKEELPFTIFWLTVTKDVKQRSTS